jgi:hypothetical protein
MSTYSSLCIIPFELSSPAPGLGMSNLASIAKPVLIFGNVLLAFIMNKKVVQI